MVCLVANAGINRVCKNHFYSIHPNQSSQALISSTHQLNQTKSNQIKNLHTISDNNTYQPK
jgi:hypothetical protein